MIFLALAYMLVNGVAVAPLYFVIGAVFDLVLIATLSDGLKGHPAPGVSKEVERLKAAITKREDELWAIAEMVKLADDPEDYRGDVEALTDLFRNLDVFLNGIERPAPPGEDRK